MCVPIGRAQREPQRSYIGLATRFAALLVFRISCSNQSPLAFAPEVAFFEVLPDPRAAWIAVFCSPREDIISNLVKSCLFSCVARVSIWLLGEAVISLTVDGANFLLNGQCAFNISFPGQKCVRACDGRDSRLLTYKLFVG